MLQKDVVAELSREPFIPLRMYVTNGRTFDIKERRAAHVLSYGLLVLIGLKLDGVRAKGYDRFGFDAIERIEPLPKGRRSGSRKPA